MNRRNLLTALLAASAIATTLATALPARGQQLFRHPFVGGVTDSSAIVAVWLASQGTFRIQYDLDPLFPNPRQTAAVASSAATDHMTKVELTGLLPRTRYHYRITSESGVPVSAPFSFTTFPKQGTDAPVTLFFGSCQQRTPTDTGGTFKVAAQLGGDLFIQMGDWGYPDEQVSGFPTREGSLREAYAMKLDTTYPFARDILSQMGMAYVWDDHDYYGNDADGNLPAPLKAQLAGAFRTYIPHYPLTSQTGVWQRFSIGNVDVFVVDARSQRKPVDSAFKNGQFQPGPGHSMLAGYADAGVDQRTWLLNGLRESKARWKVVISPVFFNPATAPLIPLSILLGRPEIATELADKWIGYPEDVDSLRKLFAAGYGRNLLIASGDAHTNAFDNGVHSVVPEFMSANLEIENSNIVRVLKSQGFDVWTGIQPDSLSTVARLRIETTPVHRMVIESFSEKGTRELTLILADSSSTSAVPAADGAAPGVITRAAIGREGRNLHLEIAGRAVGQGWVSIVDETGREVTRLDLRLNGERSIDLPLSSPLPAGYYLAGVSFDGRWMPLRIEMER